MIIILASVDSVKFLIKEIMEGPIYVRLTKVQLEIIAEN